MLKLIAATERSQGIGYKGALPWEGKHLEDLAYFREQTKGTTVVMGMNTFTSLNRPEGLPKRLNIVITSKAITNTENVLYMSYSAFLNYLQNRSDQTFWVIGGAQLYRRLMPWCEELHISRIDADYPSDTYLSYPMNFKRLFTLTEEKSLSDVVTVEVYTRTNK